VCQYILRVCNYAAIIIAFSVFDIAHGASSSQPKYPNNIALFGLIEGISYVKSIKSNLLHKTPGGSRKCKFRGVGESSDTGK